MPTYYVDERLVERAIASLTRQHFPVALVTIDVRPRVASSILGSAHQHIRTSLPLSIPAARNRALEQVATEWVAWLDGDDTLEPDCLHRLYVQSSDNDIVIGRCRVISAASVQVRPSPKAFLASATAGSGGARDPLVHSVFAIQPQLFRVPVLREMGAFDESFTHAELTELLLRYVATYGPARIGFSEDAVYNYYRFRPDAHSQDRDALSKHRIRALTAYAAAMGHPNASIEYSHWDEQSQAHLYSFTTA